MGALISLISGLMLQVYAMNDTDIVENNISPCQASVIDVNDMELRNVSPAKCSCR